MTTAHITDPPSGKKNLGWEFEEAPPSDYENWRTKTVALWFQWFNERVFDGVFGVDPEESWILAGDGVACLEITSQGPIVLTDLLSFSADLSCAMEVDAGYVAFVTDYLVDTNTGLYYDRVADEWGLKIKDATASFVLAEHGYVRISNKPGSTSERPTLALLDRRGSDASGKRWEFQLAGSSGILRLQQFTQAGVSEGLALAIDGSTPALRRWIFQADASQGSVLEPATDYLTNPAGFLGSPSNRWNEVHSKINYEAEPPHGYWREDTTISIPDNTYTDIMPRYEILTQSMTVNDTTRRLTMPVTKGRYKLDFVLRMKASAASLNVLFQLLKNGTVEGAGAWTINAINFEHVGEYQLIPLTFMVDITNVSDYIQLQAYHNGGVGVTATCDEESRLTAVCVKKVF